ncbi:MAG TPA: flagellar basal body L-ring protein FlgH, partial [Negativicutes bacterium]|nr:flagellar basal body L-ring protein FlgH [Negativicutes bacterium]
MLKTKKASRRCLAVIVTFIIGFVAVLPITNVHADSLWSDSAATSVLFGDQRARAVGDILTIVVNESSTAARTGSSSNTKAAAGTTTQGTGLLGFLPESSLGQDDSFSSKGSINNTNTVKARLTVQVIEIKPNGNLVISGTQNIKQNGEEQRIVISGQVRPSDIKADNSVLSSNIADAKITVTGNGPIASKQKQGILTQIWNWLF